jgi:hypothetical protein
MEYYGTVTTERYSRDAKYQKVILVPVEIELPWELDQVAKMAYSKIWEYLTRYGLSAAISKE